MYNSIISFNDYKTKVSSLSLSSTIIEDAIFLSEVTFVLKWWVYTYICKNNDVIYLISSTVVSPYTNNTEIHLVHQEIVYL